MACLVDYTIKVRRAAVFGLMNISWSVGSMIGPSVGGFLADSYGWNYTFYFLVMMTIISLFPAFMLKDLQKPREDVELIDRKLQGIKVVILL